MNTLIVIFALAIAAAIAAPSVPSAVVAGPSGVVTGHGPIGPVGHGLGWGAAPLIAGHGVWGAPALGLGWGHGGVAVGAHGVAVKGPWTVPAVVAGPSGKIVADGLYGVPHGW